MTNKLLTIIFIFSFISLSIHANKGGDEIDADKTNPYKLVWQDLFEGDFLDETNNWYIEENGDGGGNEELQYYRRENISIEKEPVSGNSCLVLTARKESYRGKTVTSGRLITQDKMTFKYGKIEARIKSPKTANGLWPAFWLLGADYDKIGWPGCGEIDIMEMGHVNGIENGTQDRLFNGACHWGYPDENWNNPMYANEKVSSYDLQDDFHLFTLIWDEYSIRMYLDLDVYPDGDPYYEMMITDVSSAQSVGHYFHKPYFVIFNLAVGGNFTGIWNINNVTALESGEAKMYVDYVKLYQKGESGEEFTGVGVPTSINHFPEEFSAEYEYSPADKTVRFSENVQQISLVDLSGREIKKKLNDSCIATDCLPAGIYMVRAERYNHKLITGKIIIN